jgi:hypothetical protein
MVSRPAALLRRLAHAAIDMGCKIVVCHNAHGIHRPQPGAERQQRAADREHIRRLAARFPMRRRVEGRHVPALGHQPAHQHVPGGRPALPAVHQQRAPARRAAHGIGPGVAEGMDGQQAALVPHLVAHAFQQQARALLVQSLAARARHAPDHLLQHGRVHAPSLSAPVCRCPVRPTVHASRCG